MTEEKREKILALLGKLEALANDKSTTPEESALAAERMQELATRYNIELAELDTYDPSDLPEILRGELYTENGIQIQTWKEMTLNIALEVINGLSANDITPHALGVYHIWWD